MKKPKEISPQVEAAMKVVGSALKGRRKALGKTQGEISYASVISKIEDGADVYLSTMLTYMEVIGMLDQFIQSLEKAAGRGVKKSPKKPRTETPPDALTPRTKFDDEYCARFVYNEGDDLSKKMVANSRTLRRVFDRFPDADIVVLQGTALSARKDGFAVRKIVAENGLEFFIIKNAAAAAESRHEYQTADGFIGGWKGVKIHLPSIFKKRVEDDRWVSCFTDSVKDQLAGSKVIVDEVCVKDNIDTVRLESESMDGGSGYIHRVLATALYQANESVKS